MINKLNEITKEYQQNISNLIENSTKLDYLLKKHTIKRIKIVAGFEIKLNMLKKDLKQLKKQIKVDFIKQIITKQQNKINYILKTIYKKKLEQQRIENI